MKNKPNPEHNFEDAANVFYVSKCRIIQNSLTFDPYVIPNGRVYIFSKAKPRVCQDFYYDNANQHEYPIFLIGRTNNMCDCNAAGTTRQDEIRFNDDNEREYYEIIREGKKPVFGLWRPDDSVFKLKCWLDTVCVEGVDTRYDDSEAEIAREQYGQDSVLKIKRDGCHETLPETRNRNLREALGT